MRIRSLGQKDPLEGEMAAHCSILAWEISRTEEPDGLQLLGLQKIEHDLATEQQQQYVFSIFFFNALWPAEFKVNDL